MMFREIEFLTPNYALLAFSILLPLLAGWRARRRRVRSERFLGLPRAIITQRLVSATAWLIVVFIGVSLAFALATPVRLRKTMQYVRDDVEVYIVADHSRSMLAAPYRGAPTRWNRLVRIVDDLRVAVPEVKMGLAVFSDRPLVHVYPTADPEDFLGTLHVAAGVDIPPPSVFVTPDAGIMPSVTSFDILETIVQYEYFSSATAKKIVVLLSDGEVPSPPSQTTIISLRKQHIQLIAVHIWGEGERIFSPGKPEPYRTDFQAPNRMEEFAQKTGAPLLREQEVSDLPSVLRARLGSGPVVSAGERDRYESLAWIGWVIALIASVFYVSSFLRFRKQ